MNEAPVAEPAEQTTTQKGANRAARIKRLHQATGIAEEKFEPYPSASLTKMWDRIRKAVKRESANGEIPPGSQEKFRASIEKWMTENPLSDPSSDSAEKTNTN